MKDALEQRYLNLYNREILALFRRALRISMRYPSRLPSLARVIARQYRAGQIRRAWLEKGYQIPPVMIFSITNRCNLRCKGCYSWAQHRPKDSELKEDKMREVIAEANSLGISTIILAGGEPLVRKDVLEIAGDYPSLTFVLFTNGLLIDDRINALLRSHRNIIPVISLEGNREDTDERRGEGTYDRVIRVMANLKQDRLIFGTAITLTRENYPTVMNGNFMRMLCDTGCSIIFTIDYVPIETGTDSLILTDEQIASEPVLMEEFRRDFPGVFVSFPGDEDKFGGCMSSGRGFIHISAAGDVEPCPASPYSDANLKESTLKDALQSRLLTTIRSHRQMLSETGGTCALWENREWVISLLPKKENGTTGTL